MSRPSHYDDHRDAILSAIEKRTTYNMGKPPTMRDISQDTGCSLATLHTYLLRMRDENLITFSPKLHRSLRVNPGARQHA